MRNEAAHRASSEAGDSPPHNQSCASSGPQLADGKCGQPSARVIALPAPDEPLTILAW